MINFQSSIDELQREYNRNYTKLEGLERYYEDNKPWKKNKIALEVSYKIEKRKLKVRNQIIKKSIKALQDEQQQIQKLSSRYYINYQVETSTHEELHHCQEQTQEILKDQYQSLDVSITMETLEREMYFKIYTKSEIVLTSFLKAGMSATILGMLALLVSPPIVPFYVLVGMRIGLEIFFVTFSIASGIALRKKNKKTRTIFGRLYEEYKQKNQFERKSYQEQTCDDMIEQITKTRLTLLEQKTKIEQREKVDSIKEKKQISENIMAYEQYSYEDYGKQKCKQF